MHILHDPDEWETVSTYQPCTVCGGDLTKCNGACNGSASFGLKRRDPTEVAKIKAEKQRRHEDEVLAEAAAIVARRQNAG